MNSILKTCSRIYSVFFSTCMALLFLDINFPYKEEFLLFHFWSGIFLFILYEIISLFASMVKYVTDDEFKRCRIIVVVNMLTFYYFRNQFYLQNK